MGGLEFCVDGYEEKRKRCPLIEFYIQTYRG